MHTRLTPWAAVLLSGIQLEATCRAQTYETQKGEPEMQSEDVTATPTRYTASWGSGGFNLSAGLRGVYVDNVFLTHSGARDDFILVPECDIAAYFPIGQSTTLVVDLGLAYYQYLKNTALNSSTPLINPNSELAFNIHSGEFTFRLSESFSYQESPVYDSTSQDPQ